MTRLRVLFSKLTGLFRKAKLEQQLDEDVQAHLEMLTEENLRRGMDAKEARYAALRQFGNVSSMKEECRERWSIRIIEELIQDIRYGLRQLRRNPGFTAVAILTLALGIGANTAIFSIVEAVFLRPLPFPQSDRIYVVDRVSNPIGGPSISMPIYLAWKQKGGLFDHLALVNWRSDSIISSGSETQEVPSAGASTGLFPVLGIRPELGRNFMPEEGRPGGGDVVILSDGLWRTWFGADRSILGKAITINHEPYTVVGIMPRGFQLPLPGVRDAGLWFPVRVPPTSNNPANGGILCLGLLKKGAAPAQAAAALTPPLKQLRQEFPKMFGPNEGAHLEPLRSFLAHWAGPAPLLLFGAVGLVLLLVCVNVANMALARSSTRQREIATRIAIGAGRRRIVRQLLAESVLLALLGGMLGVFLCYATFTSVVSLIPVNTVHVGNFQIDGVVLAFAFALSIGTGLVFGLAPALTAARADVNCSLKEGDLRAGSSGFGRVQGLLAASELSVSLVVLIGAALVIESFVGLLRVHPGFDPSHLLTFKISLPQNRYRSPAERSAFLDRALARLRALPGIDQVALTNVLPLEGGGDILFNVVGSSAPTLSGEAFDADIRVASPDFFQTMRMPLLRGRTFSTAEDASSQPVVIINKSMANMCWHTQNPIGQQIWIGKPMGPAESEPSPREIIGVVGDARTDNLAQPPAPTMYIPFAQSSGVGEAAFVVRSKQAPLAAVPEVRAAMRSLDSDLLLNQVNTMEDVVTSSLTDWRFHTILLAVFGGLALLIAAIGIYGVVSYSVTRRIHEIGIRMALGAERRDVLKMIVGQGLKLALIGVAIGIAGALALTRFLSSLLYGVKPTDPLTFVAVSLILIAVALLACYIPARRAAKVDPMVALRYE